MKDRNKLKEILTQALIDKGDVERLSDVMAGDEDEEKKKLLLMSMMEQGKPDKALSFLQKDEERLEGKKQKKVNKVLSDFADLITQETKGTFMDELQTRLDNTTSETSLQLFEYAKTSQEQFEKAVKELLTANDASQRENHARLLDQAAETLKNDLSRLIQRLAREEADRLAPEIKEKSRLTAEEIEQIEWNAALSVESQIPLLVKSYIEEAGVLVSQVKGLRSLVEELTKIDWDKVTLDWKQIKNRPDWIGRGAGARALYWLNDVALTDVRENELLQYNPTTQKWYNGIAITVSATAPSNPKYGDLWIDVS